MEILVPPLLTAVREVRWMVSAGHSMKDAFRLYLDSTGDELAEVLRERWTLKWQSRNPQATPPRAFRSHYQSALWELVERGCRGEPVMEALTSLENEVDLAAQAELDLHVATLPFKVLIPLLLFQFPAFMILMLGPMLRELSQHLGG